MRLETMPSRPCSLQAARVVPRDPIPQLPHVWHRGDAEIEVLHAAYEFPVDVLCDLAGAKPSTASLCRSKSASTPSMSTNNRLLYALTITASPPSPLALRPALLPPHAGAGVIGLWRKLHALLGKRSNPLLHRSLARIRALELEVGDCRRGDATLLREFIAAPTHKRSRGAQLRSSDHKASARRCRRSCQVRHQCFGLDH